MFFNLGKTPFKTPLVVHLILILMTSGSFLIGCDSLRIGKGLNSEKKSLNFSDGESCFDELPNWIRRYSRGLSSDDEVKGFWGCLSEGVGTFSHYVEGSQEGVYTVKEIKYILEKFILKNEISEEKLSYIMEIKTLLVGGNEQTLSIEELNKVQGMLSDLEFISLQMRPYVDIFFLRENWNQYSGEKAWRLTRGIHTFLNIQKRLGQVLAKNNKDYDLSRLPLFLKSLESLIQPDKKWDFIHLIESHIPLIKLSKMTVLGPPEDKILHQQWPLFFSFLGVSFTQYIRAQVIGQTGLVADRSWEQVQGMLNELSDFLLTVRSEGGNESISVADILKILDEVRVLWPDFPELKYKLDPILTLKEVLVGGDKNKWSAEDVAHISEWGQVLFNLQKNLSPYLSVYSLSWRPKQFEKQEQQYLERSLLILENQFNELHSHISQGVKAPYPIRSIVDLLDIITQSDIVVSGVGLSSTSLNSKSVESRSNPFLDEMVSLLSLYKELFIGGNKELVEPADWKPLINLTRSLWSEYLRIHYHKTYRFGHSKDILSRSQEVDSLINLLNTVKATLKSQNIENISIEKLSLFIDKIASFFLGEGLGVEDIRKALKLKKALFGGNETQINLDEMDKLILLSYYIQHYSGLMEGLVYLNPNYVISNPVSDNDWANFKKSARLMARDLGFFIKSNGLPVSVADVSKVLKRWLAKNGSASLSDIFSESYLRNIKALIVGDESSVIGSTQWSHLTQNSMGIYLSFLDSIRDRREELAKEGYGIFIRNPIYLDKVFKELAQILKDEKRSLSTQALAHAFSPFASKISLEKLTALMASFKELFIYGNSLEWTSEEIARTPEHLQEWVKLFVLIEDYSDVLSFKKDIPKERFNAFNKKLRRAIAQLGTKLSQRTDNVEVEKISVFISSFSEVFGLPLPDSFKNGTVLKHYLELLLGKTTTIIEPGNGVIY